MKYAVPVVALLLSAPFFLPGFHVTLLTEILIFALFAMSLDVQVGYARMFSFGHAAPYGVGAYVAAFALVVGKLPLPIAILIAVVAVFILSIPIGWLCTRASGVAFAMLTLAFAQLAFAVAFKWNAVTGGSDGISGLIRNPGPWGFAGLESRDGYYWLTVTLVVGTAWLASRFVRSPMGTAIVAVRENEKRAIAIGYEPRQLRLAAFVISNTGAGLAGALHAGFLLFVSPELLHWTLSGYVLVAVVLGGSGTLIGPMIGAALMVIGGHQLSAIATSWPLFMGLLFMIVVVVAPNGLWGIKSSISNALALRKASRLEMNHVAS
ncbi:branched-chain amino acid ABC transporter permease [Bradyrhizobium sp. CIAT3101]|uniref:branched-chain amino acid ABC transporter permease n=1 Tax=Bradyrhizobium sp. CIAT3101 TaxID=439387 RepID=UPI0024B1E86A|nr:branched-chain amino acid ABC transporter permease [Bradyrhizobium sp. CIAT3101]WFU79227.1 branched-chain amino acid ABC transporter permease [Bradyrhizobium sp. CIAT3101]